MTCKGFCACVFFRLDKIYTGLFIWLISGLGELGKLKIKPCRPNRILHIHFYQMFTINFYLSSLDEFTNCLFLGQFELFITLGVSEVLSSSWLQEQAHLKSRAMELAMLLPLLFIMILLEVLQKFMVKHRLLPCPFEATGYGTSYVSTFAFY